MELIKLESQIPIKSIPEKELNTIFVEHFNIWLSDLLSLTDEVSAKRLYLSAPAIKQHCWSMGFAEIKRMFEMYADNRLSIKPIPNYFDRILLGKIVEAYKNQKPMKKKTYQHYTSPDEIEFIMTEAVDRIQKDYQQNGCITEMCHHVYDYLFEQGELPKDKEYKDLIFKIAKSIRILELKQGGDVSNRKETNKLLDEINKDLRVVIIAKRLVLEDYFKNIEHEKIN